MERRSCGKLHFINAIKGNSVLKLRNTDAYGKPTLVFKAVKDILEAEDVKRLQPSSSQGAQCPLSYCLPRVDRSLQEIDSRENLLFSHGGDDGRGNDSDEDNFGELTLRQLKEECKAKKRKHSNSGDFKEHSELEPEKDDSDLEVPLSSLKLKIPKAKRKRVLAASDLRRCGSFIKSEQNPDPEMQFHMDLSLLVQVKAEVPEPVINEGQHIIPFLDDSFVIIQTDESSTATEISDGAPHIAECQNSKPILFTEHYQSCNVNEVSYDHLENVEPFSPPFSRHEDTLNVDGQEESCQQLPDLPISEDQTKETEQQLLLITDPADDDNSYMNSFSRSFRHMQDFVEQTSCSHAIPVSNLVVDECVSSKDLYHGSELLSSGDDARKCLASDPQIDATGCHALCLITDDDLLCGTTEQKQPLLCKSPNGAKNCVEPVNHLVLLEDKSTLDENDQNKVSLPINEEKQEERMSSSVLGQPPERLLLTRKVISPTSEERLSLSMSSAESYIDGDSKDNPCPSKPTENKASLGSEIKHTNIVGKPEGSGLINRTKVTISPTRRSKNGKRNSPPKGNLEGTRLARSLPNLSTGCTSLQGCSESAIAFSRRQMQDIESLAVKLMNELKYMKEIVEEKLLFEAYHNASLKNDADEVKDAVTNAMKVEETARKWLSMMTRDCNRFCKIMSLTQKGTAPSTSNSVQRERKKITFADEVGGNLCHVKVFGDEMTLEPNSEKQKDQNT